MKHNTEQRKDKHERKSWPCSDTDMLAKARCSEYEESMLETKETAVKVFPFSFSLLLLILGHIYV